MSKGNRYVYRPNAPGNSKDGARKIAFSVIAVIALYYIAVHFFSSSLGPENIMRLFALACLILIGIFAYVARKETRSSE